jgi:hypothetical protein
MQVKKRSIKKGAIFSVCCVGVLASVATILLVLAINEKVEQLCREENTICVKIDSLQKNNNIISERIKRIENQVIPSDSIIECFVGHNPKVESGYAMIYKNSKLPLKRKNIVLIKNEKSKGSPSVELEVKENSFEKEIETKAEMYINTETFKTLGIEGKGLDQGVFIMELRKIK